MATALIRINQAANPSPIGIAGVARRDLVLSSPVTLANSDDTDVNRWRWQMVDLPLGSTAVLSAIDSPVVTFTPDVEGSYLVQLAVNDGTFGQIDRRVAAVETAQGFRYPATSETDSATNFPLPTLQGKGWGKDTERILRAQSVPQYVAAAQGEIISVALATQNISVGGLGLPKTVGEITGEGFVDGTGVNVGVPPTVNSYTPSTIVGTNGVSADVLTADIDGTPATNGDEWLLVVKTTTVGDLLLANLTMGP